MRICVCVKEVPPTSVALKLDPATGRLARGKGRLNAPDQYALEEALRIRDERADGTEVVAVAMGPAHAEDAVRSTLASGADRAVLVSDERLAGSDMLATSRVLARALEREQPDLVVFGWEGTDGNGAMLWAAVAGRLRMPVLSRVWELSVGDGAARVKRQMEYGIDVAEAPLPAVVAISGAINLPRNPGLKDVVASRKKSVDVVGLDAVGVAAEAVGEAGSRTRVLDIGRPPTREPSLLIEDQESAAEKLLQYLTEKGIV